MKTMTPIEALEGAIEMLEAIARGESWSVFTYHDRAREFRHALDAHRAAEAVDDRKRIEIRTRAAQLRAARQNEGTPRPASVSPSPEECHNAD